MKATFLSKSMRNGVCLGLVVMLLAMLAMPALAYSQSAKISKTVYGVTYTFYSSIDETWDHDIESRVGVEVSKTVGAGYIGAKNRIYTSDGTLARASDWVYNSNNVQTNIGFLFFLDAEPYTYYYSKGQVQLYNGNGYTTYTCNSTPYISVSNSRSTSVPVNCNGETYGSEVFLNQMGIEPDLIKALGENGVIGYVKADDLDNSPVICPEDISEYLSNLSEHRTIPLYAEDGITVIGSFVIDNSWSE